MHGLLSQLQSDHKNLARLIEVLEKQLDDFHEGNEHDIDLMCEVVEYVASYEDQVHHPTEDLIFARLKELTDDKRVAIETLEEQHGILEQMTHKFAQTLEAVIQGDVILRHDVESAGRAMLKTLRQHMDLEEGEVFPMAAAILSEQDWEKLKQDAPRINDPVFGDPDPARFRSVFMHLSQELGLNQQP